MLVGDYLYGANEQGDLACMNFKTGEVKWLAMRACRRRPYATPMVCFTFAATAAAGFGLLGPSWVARRKRPRKATRKRAASSSRITASFRPGRIPW